MTADGAPGRPRWAVALAAVIVLGVIVAVSGAVGRPDAPARRGPQEAVERWRRDDLGGGRVRTTDRFVVHEADGTLTVLDLADGTVAWSDQLAAGPSAEWYADDDVIALVGHDGRDRVRLRAVATATGEVRLDRVFDGWTSATDPIRVGDALSLSVTSSDDGRGERRVVLSLDDGAVRDLVTGPHTVVRSRQALVVSGADEVVGVSGAGADAVDWRADGQVTDVDLTAGRLLMRTSSGYEVRAMASGERLWSTVAEGVQQAQFIGSWVGLSRVDGMTVVRPEDGGVVFRRGGVGATARVAHLALDPHTVVAWPQEGGTELVVYDGDGVEVATRTVAGDDPASAWLTLAPVAGRPTLVQVVTDAGRSSIWLDLASARSVREVRDTEPGAWDRDFAAGVLWRSRDRELVLEGPAGSLSVEGMTEPVAIDPLVVHGPAGLARLDPAALLATSADG